MKNKKILEFIKSRDIVIPLYLYKYYPKLNISLEEFVFLMYLSNRGDNLLFDPTVIENDMGLDLKKVMELISKLTDNKLINLEVKKNDKNIMEEYISLDNFYQKINMIIIDELNNSSGLITRLESFIDIINMKRGITNG